MTGPICHAHGPKPAQHGLGGAWPAHTWSSEVQGACQRCPAPVVEGDLYVCNVDPPGIVHVTCPAECDETDPECRCTDCVNAGSDVADHDTAELAEPPC